MDEEDVQGGEVHCVHSCYKVIMGVGRKGVVLVGTWMSLKSIDSTQKVLSKLSINSPIYDECETQSANGLAMPRKRVNKNDPNDTVSIRVE